MNWKNITLEAGFIKQELSFNEAKAVNYIPLTQIDSFGVVSSENKRWLYAGIFFGFCSLLLIMGSQVSAALVIGMLAAGFIFFYFMSRQTWLSITSSQTKFSVQVSTTKEEIQAVNEFIMQIKQAIQKTGNHLSSVA